jgi:glycopeptide antibiotics resistance protein
MKRKLMEGGKARKVTYTGLVAGLVLHLTTFLRAEGGVSSFSIGLLIWSLLPYVVVIIILHPMNKPQRALGATGTILFMDLWMYKEVFVTPGSSTAALGLLFMPLWNMIIFIPLGFLLGWLFLERKQKSEASGKTQQDH